MNSNVKLDYNRITNKESISSFSDLVKCKICFNVLLNPHDCENCGNTFCYECINKLKTNKKPCPFNCGVYSIRPSSFGITSLLTTLVFECVNEGCEEKIPYLGISKHDTYCNFLNSTCPNVKCNKVVKRNLLEYHIRRECEFTMFKCEICESNLIREDYLQHVKNCKNISDIFDLKTPIINKSPEVDDLDLKNFMQILLYNLSKNRIEMDKKITSIAHELELIKETTTRQGNYNTVLIENLHSEIESIAEKISMNELGYSLTDKKYEDNIRSTITEESIRNSSHNNSVTTNPMEKSINFDSKTTTSTVKADSNYSTETSSVKKIRIEAVKGKKVALNKSKSPMRSTANKSPVTVNRNAKDRTLYFETESSHIRTSNIALLKATIRNQDIIMQKLNKLLEKAESNEKSFTNEMTNNKEELKMVLESLLGDFNEKK